MKLFAKVWKSVAVISLAAILIFSGTMLAPLYSGAQTNYPGNAAAMLPNYRYAPMVFTATSQTKTQTLGGIGSATLLIKGPASAATLTVSASNDGGTTYVGIPYSDATVVATTLTIKAIAAGAFPAYAGTPVMYYINLSGYTNVKVVSSGTFTGASATVQIVGSSNRGIF